MTPPSVTPQVIKLVSAAIISDRRVLMGKRSSTVKWYRGLWDLPGGHVEPDEDEVSAIVREVHEEIGVTICRPSDEPIFRLYDRAPDGRPIAELSTWLVRRWKGQPRNADPRVHDEVAWCDLQLLRSLPLAHPEYRELLGNLLSD